MRNIATLFFSIAIMFSFSGTVVAQEKARIKISHVKQKGELVLFSLSSSKPFIFGNNKYYLHIGDKEFTRNEQSKNKGKGLMTFFIPADDYKGLQDNAGIYLTYGVQTIEGVSMDDLSKENFVQCWSLGKFNKTLLTK